MRLVSFILATALLAVTQVPALAEPLAEITGTWRTVRHGALVRIGDCGNRTPCGWLVWAPETYLQGIIHDIRNRDPSKRARPLIGVPILYGFAPQPPGWRDGRLYNPDDGKTFTAHLHPLSPDRLRVTGCLGPLCRSQVWTRAHEGGVK